MSYTLGIDVGANSLGWALVEDDKKIVDMGVRIFPEGVDNYDQAGKEKSKNSSRRDARGARRRYHRIKLRKENLRQELFKLGMLPDYFNQTTKELYSLRKKGLHEKIELQELGRIFWLLNSRRGFKSNRKEKAIAEENSEKEKDLGVVKKGIQDLENKIFEANCKTVGEYFYYLIEKNNEIENWRNEEEPIERIRGRWVSREMYIEEFNLLWNEQRKYYPEVLTNEAKNRIKDYCIFYQRPLKSAKHLVNGCQFEKDYYKDKKGLIRERGRKVCPRSHPEFQEFRLWQDINNLRVTNSYRFRDPLNTWEKETLFEIAKRQTILDPNLKKVCKQLQIAGDNPFGDVNKLKGLRTLNNVSNILNEDKINEIGLENIWHILYSFEDENWIEKHFVKKYDLRPDFARKLAREVVLEPDYGSLSLKAIRRILPYLKEGLGFADACLHAGYHHSYDEETDGKEREVKEFVPYLENNELRNPLVQQSTSEVIRVVNAIIRAYGKPDTVRVEMARELNMPKSKRMDLRKNNQNKEKLREIYADFLTVKLNRKVNPWDSDIRKYELWLELGFANEEDNVGFENDFKRAKLDPLKLNADKYKLWIESNRICPYTGKFISLTKLFSAEFEIEHIYPVGLTLDNSFNNKTLCERNFNGKKGRKLPYDYIYNELGDKAWEEFKQRVLSIPNMSQRKKERLISKSIPEEFTSNKLNNTAYTAKLVKQQLKFSFKNVEVVKGGATSILRQRWGLNTLLNDEDAKNRGDHRHHAIDAVTIACATISITQRISNVHLQLNKRGFLENLQIPYEPFDGFRNDVEDRLARLLVSYRKNKRLLVSRQNKIKKGNTKKSYTSYTVRGQLHEETMYGKIYNPHNLKEEYVVKQPLSWIDKISKAEQIVDPVVKEIVLNRISDYNGDCKKAFVEPLYMLSPKAGKEVEIKRVRVDSRLSDKSTILLRNNTKTYAKTGNNFGMYLVNNNEKKELIVMSFYESVKKTKIEKYEWFLQQNDLVVIYNESPDEIEWNNQYYLSSKLYFLKKFSNTPSIYITLMHHLASNNKVKEIGFSDAWDKHLSSSYYATYPLIRIQSIGTLKIIPIKIDILGKITRK